MRDVMCVLNISDMMTMNDIVNLVNISITLYKEINNFRF